jgi:hypothetical protein
MLLYALTFLLYIAADVFELVAFNYNLIDNHFQEISTIYAIALIFWSSFSFLSQVLLFFILWDLSNDDDKKHETRSCEEVSVTTFDSDARLQAKIWNRF